MSWFFLEPFIKLLPQGSARVNTDQDPRLQLKLKHYLEFWTTHSALLMHLNSRGAKEICTLLVAISLAMVITQEARLAEHRSWQAECRTVECTEKRETFERTMG